MAKSRARCMVEKSVAAMVAAIEVYNKPDFKYREETFAVLAINAWELLFKAYILEKYNNRSNSLYIYENRHNKNGSICKKQFIKQNRSGNSATIGLSKSMAKIENDLGIPLNHKLKKNVLALVEIRDNSVHFFNHDIRLSKRIQEIGTATLKNYVSIIKQWFGHDLSNLNFYLMPLSFFHYEHTSTAVILNSQEEKVLEYLLNLQKTEESDYDPDFNVALDLEIRFVRSRAEEALNVRVTVDPSAPVVQLKEEDIRDRYPWDYRLLTNHLKGRYCGFKENSDYHTIRKPLQGDPKFAKERYLDPANPKSPRRVFYNPNIVNEFDKYYIRI